MRNNCVNWFDEFLLSVGFIHGFREQGTLGGSFYLDRFLLFFLFLCLF